jgi:general secretion pathway protein K
MTSLRNSARQRGVAVVTALLLTTLAITIVASLFWQQQVQVRSIENQRLQLQKQWILRGALDWTRLILRSDAPGVDHLGEPWATPLAETRLDQYVENSSSSGEAADAVLSGNIVDAQSRFNLGNLCQGGQIRQDEVAVFAKLLTSLRQNPSLAQATAAAMKAAQGRMASAASAQAASASGASASASASARASAVTATASSDSGTSQPLDILYVDDLLAVPGFTPEALEAIRDFVVVLPGYIQVNANTAPAEVLAARIATLSVADAAAVVAARETAWFKDNPDFEERVVKKKVNNQDDVRNIMTGFSTKTNYFLINGNVRLNRATMHMQALIDRSTGSPRVSWIRES